MWWNHDMIIIKSWYNDNHMMRSQWWREAASVMSFRKFMNCKVENMIKRKLISMKKKQWARKERALNHLKLRGCNEQYDSKLQLQNLQTSGSKWWPIFSHKISTKLQPQYLDQCQFQNLDQTSASKSQLSFNFKTLTKPQPRYLTQSSAKNPLPNWCQHVPNFAP